MTSQLSKDLRARAAKLPAQAADLIGAANALDRASAGYYATPKTTTLETFQSVSDRARRLWDSVNPKAKP